MYYIGGVHRLVSAGEDCVLVSWNMLAKRKEVSYF
jgi:hypothetical protein